jgi:hypothetical protein
VAAGPASDVYVETHLYDTYADPHQHVNLAGRPQFRDTAAALRERLLERLAAAGEAAPEVVAFPGQTAP